MTDGLSQNLRMQRLDVLEAFSPIDNRMEVLLRQVEEIASYIHYYALNNKPDGTFDQLLNDIKKIREAGSIAEYSEDTEPSQALLYTFAHQLNSLIQPLNKDWTYRYISWYINNVLGVKSELLLPDFTWIQLKANNRRVELLKGTGFTYSEVVAENKIYYRLTENIQINSMRVAKVYALHLQKNPDIYPANLFSYPTSLCKKDITASSSQPRLFEQSSSREDVQDIGLQITSPSLLLGEGKRKVTLSFYSEDKAWEGLTMLRMIIRLVDLRIQQGESKKDAKENVLIKLLNAIFHLKISTPNGWTSIDGYAARYNSGSIILQFQLDESFPSAIACDDKLHGADSKFPALKILLNNNAWLYPYTWLKDFRIKKIVINTQVGGVTDIVFYNELGEVDTSKPFAPFGINTEQSAWFVIGCYEMAIKNTQYVDVQLRWHQLPKKERGFYDYYYDYENEITNLSFKIRPRYLSDYKWNNTSNQEPFYLFSTAVKDKYGRSEAYGKLSDESMLRKVSLKGVSPIDIDRDSYSYDIRSKNGFLNFVLEEPEMGFGEKFYRQLYTRLLMTKAFRKKNSQLNQPLNPLIDRITLSYEASDELDLLAHSKVQHTQLYHLYPLGKKQVYPQPSNKPIPFVYQTDSDANILFGLENVQGEEQLNLYIELFPQEEEVSLFKLPEIAWYWGDGYRLGTASQRGYP